jgi:enoyl-CoA hydratase/3-hydroxyacyl-CoA dehydrogenase
VAECCRLVEEGVGGVRETDLGMALGAGIAPGPFARADDMGLDVVLQTLEWAKGEWGEAFEPPALLRRLVAQGRLGKKTGQGFYAYPQPDAGEQLENVLFESRGPVAVAWLDRKPVNPLSPNLIADLRAVHEKVEADEEIRVLVIASANTAIFSAGADLKAFSEFDEGGVETLVTDAHAVFRALETGNTLTIAAVGGAALGGGCELALACDLRVASESASFGLPEITLGIVPGFGGTQRLRRIVGQSKALALMATGDSIGAWEALECGLADEVVVDHELFDAALRLAERLAGQAPLAVRQLKRLADDSALDADLERERRAFVEIFQTADAAEGIGAFLQKRKPSFSGK